MNGRTRRGGREGKGGMGKGGENGGVDEGIMPCLFEGIDVPGRTKPEVVIGHHLEHIVIVTDSYIRINLK